MASPGRRPRRKTMNQTIPPPAALRKLAILISTLDPLSADALLEKMPNHIAEIVRQIVPELENVDSEECDEVIEEFMLAGGQSIFVRIRWSRIGCVVTKQDLFAKWLCGTQRIPCGQWHRPPPTPFSFLREGHRRCCGAAFGSPTSASHRGRRRSLTSLPSGRCHQAPVAQITSRRAASSRRLDAADQEIVLDIERELEALLSDELRIARNRQTGLSNVMTILNAAGGERNVLLESLTEHERGLAVELQTGKRDLQPTRSSIAFRRPLNAKTKLPAASHLQRPSAPAPEHRSDMAASNSDGLSNGGRSLQSRPNDDRSEETVVSAAKSEPLPDFAFEDLAALGDEDWAALIRSTEPHIVLLALTGASRPTVENASHSDLPKAKLKHYAPNCITAGHCDSRISRKHSVTLHTWQAS